MKTVIEMAREAGVTDAYEYGESIPDECLERFAALIAEATKEKAAKVCEQYAENLFSRNRMEESAGVLHIAAAIRSMK